MPKKESKERVFTPEERKRLRQAERRVEKERLVNEVKRGLDDIEKELAEFIQVYQNFLLDGGEVKTRLESWSRFFKDVSFVSEERSEDGDNKIVDDVSEPSIT